MNKHRPFIYQEFSSFFNKRVLLLIAVVFIICLYLCCQGIKEYNNFSQEEVQFQKAEKKMFENLTNYTQYSIQGVRFLVRPSPNYIFFSNSGAFKKRAARINPVASIDIYSDQKGEESGDEYKRISLDFSTIIYLFGSILSLLSGYLLVHNPEYLMLLSSFKDPVKMFLYKILFRFTFIVLTFLFIFALMLVMVYAADIQLSARDYNVLAAFAGAAVLMMLSYFLAGVLTGQFLEKWTGATALLCIWIVFSFIIPGIMQTIIHKSDNYKNNHYKIKSKKLDIVSKFEKESYKKEGNFDRDRLDIFKDLAEYYWNEKYIKIESLERNYYRNIESGNRKKLGFMQLTPTTFYHVTAGEASSLGLMNSSDFHSYLIVKQKKFARFYIDRCFYHDPREMVSFIQGDENLFKSKSRLPPGYLENVIIHSCVCLILLLVSLGRFKKRLLANHDSNLTGKNKQDLEPKPGKLKVLLLNKTNFSKKAYDFYKKHYPGIHGKPAVSKNGSWFFVYLCHPDKLPGFIKVNVFIKFKMILMGLTNDMQRVILKKLNFKELKGKLMKNLSSSERGEILLTLLKGIKDRRPLFMLNDIAKDLPFEFTIKIKEWIEEMKEAGAFVVYLTTVPVTKDKRFQSDQDYEELPEWEKSVELIKNVINKTAIC